MTHLSESELVDLAENDAALDPRRATHLDECASCREQADMLRAMLRDTRAVDVPDPSPLFWDQFSARVRDEVASAPGAGGSGWQWFGVRGLVPYAAAAALLIAVVSGAFLLRAGRVNTASPFAGRVNTASTLADRNVSVTAPARPEATPDAENAEVWAVLTAAASSVEFDEAHDAGMHVHPAAIEHAVQDLTAAEMTELGRLLQSELKRSSN